MSITPSLDDFKLPPINGNFGTLRGIHGGPTEITAFGFVRWRVTDTKGDSHIFRVPAYYVPEAHQRLMSPQIYADFHGWDISKGNGAFHGHQQDMWIQLAIPDSNEVRFLNGPMSKIDGLPYFEATLDDCHESSKPKCTCQHTCPACNTAQLHDHLLETVGYSMEVLSEANENLSAAQKDLLLDHQRLGHIDGQVRDLSELQISSR